MEFLYKRQNKFKYPRNDNTQENLYFRYTRKLKLKENPQNPKKANEIARPTKVSQQAAGFMRDKIYKYF